MNTEEENELYPEEYFARHKAQLEEAVSFVLNELRRGVQIQETTPYIWADFLTAFEEPKLTAHDIFMVILHVLYKYDLKVKPVFDNLEIE